MVMTGARDSTVTQKQQTVPEDILRLTPVPMDEPYKCPVSTPLNGKRSQQTGTKHRLQFVSVDCSQLNTSSKQGFHNISGRKVPVRYKNPVKQARKRNFDYYYVDKAFQKKLESYTNSTWLRTLCAQPVDEIFYKYRKSLILPQRYPEDSKARSFATPGERAILEAWESNSSKRGNSAASRFSKTSKNSQSTSRSISPNLTIVSKSYARNGQNDQQPLRNDSRIDSVPHPPTPGGNSEGSQANSRTATPTNKETINHMEIFPSFEYDYYNQFKRKDQQQKLPEIQNKRTLVTGPQKRKYFSHSITSLSHPVKQAVPVHLSSEGLANQNLEINNKKLNSNCTICELSEIKVLP